MVSPGYFRPLLFQEMDAECLQFPVFLFSVGDNGFGRCVDALSLIDAALPTRKALRIEEAETGGRSEPLCIFGSGSLGSILSPTSSLLDCRFRVFLIISHS